jgi:hypothetical protein
METIGYKSSPAIVKALCQLKIDHSAPTPPPHRPQTAGPFARRPHAGHRACSIGAQPPPRLAGPLGNPRARRASASARTPSVVVTPFRKRVRK